MMKIENFAASKSLRTVDLDNVLAPAASRRKQSQFSLPNVTVVIPTLNEADNIRLLLPRMPDWIHEIIIVDGCSIDDTIDVARSARPDVKIVIEKRRGKGVALRAGFEAATGEIVVMMDADGSMDPDEIILFVAALVSGADFAKGSRFLQGAGTTDMTFFRRLGNQYLTLAVRLLYGSSFSDLCYGYLAFWTRHVPILRSECDGFEIETLINIRALKNQLKIKEVASFESDRIYGESNLRAIPDGWRVLKTIFRERLDGRRVAPAQAAH
jgi:glycosyltransferase involved in cell wall biosynthesis